MICCGLAFYLWDHQPAQAQFQPPAQPAQQLPLSQTEGDWGRAEAQLIFAFDRLVPHEAGMIETRTTRSGLRALLSLIRVQAFQPPPPEQIVARAIRDMEQLGNRSGFRSRLIGRDALISLYEVCASGLIAAVDSHSQFIPPVASRDRRARLFGEVFDMGLNIELASQGLRVRAVTPARRAAQAGILPGDVMRDIGGASLTGMDLETAAVFLYSLGNHDLTLAIERPGRDGILRLQMPRAKNLGENSESYRIDDIIYLKLHSFGGDAREMIEREIIFSGGMDRAGSRGIILDLRGNSGGYLIAGAMVASAFLDSGIIVTAVDTNPARSKVYSATEGDLAQDLPMVVMIDHYSASAAELAAAALQDHRRALVVGAQSTGKGSVQTMYSLGQLG